jgi:hypothetical protein
MPSHIPKYGYFFEFKKDDLFNNRIKTFPKVEFLIHSSSVYYQNEAQSGSNSHTPNGHINLYDLNVNRHNTGQTVNDLIYPFITKGGSFSSFKTISTDNHNLDFALGDTLVGTYPLTASISVDRYDTTLGTEKKKVLYALKNTLNFYTVLSPDYEYSSYLGNKEAQKLNIISVPSIFYGSSIRKGSVKLKYYVTGTLMAEASDTLKNGVLKQTSGSAGMSANNIGNSVGVVLYNEGFIFLTSSVQLSSHAEPYESGASNKNSSWYYFGTTSSFAGAPSSSFSIEFEGVNYIETMTMFAHAKENQINFSNNPTFLTSTMGTYTSSHSYHEDAELEIKNIVSSSYKNYSASFKPVTYISKVGIYDENKNLIAIAGLANPVRKLEERSYTFKLKLDI